MVITQTRTTKGIIFSFKRYSVHDGSGIRQTIFFKGCPLSCWWCHNPESQDIKSERAIRKNILDGITFEQQETIGKVMTVDEVMLEIEKDSIFYDESGGGVTFSGGEPLMQYKFLLDLLRACKNAGIHTAVDTTGFANPKVFQQVANETDLFLYDLKLLDDKEHEKYTGISNKVILENLKYLNQIRKKVIIRFPVIPGINDTEENICETIKFLLPLKNIRKLSLLPYHSIANHKYDKIKMDNKMNGVKALSKKDMEGVKKRFEDIGFKVNIGG
ncbi:MAG: glycyl-radical enzyme activating protein [Bacteroidetes bacterium]|nr:MAG: glycyl-radical enzyme activating protein [Bacteroidota bacterium]